MRFDFTDEMKQEEKNMIYLEEDDLLMEGEFVEGEGKHFILTGIATIEGERYHDFMIEFELEQEADNLEEIMTAEWEWYDFLCQQMF